MRRKMHRRISNEKAFTLIEVIVCLVLIGIMAAIVGMGLVRIAEGYIFAKKNAETTQKAQIAMVKIAKELSAATITTATANSIRYTRPQGAGTVDNVITFLKPNITIQQFGAGGTAPVLIDILTDNKEVAGAVPDNLTYVYATGGTTPADIRQIGIQFTVLGANEVPSGFNSTVYVQESY